MILYSLGKYQFRFIWTLHGSVFPKAFIYAAPSGMAAVVISVLLHGWSGQVAGRGEEVWTAFSFVVGFLLVFRTSQAYARFWEGSTLVHQMRGEWLDAVQNLCAFSSCFNHSGEDLVHLQEVHDFKHLIVRLFSYLHSEALQHIAVMEDEEFSVIDGQGLDRQSAKFLQACTKKHISRVEVLHQWILVVIMREAASGVLAQTPSPILTRVLQEFSNGMVKFNDCMKINDTPFPFPYAQISVVFLMFHWLITPFVAAQSADSWVWAGVMAFASVLCLWSVNFIAGELENPFGDDINDLPTRDLQHEMNHALLALLEPEMNRVPKLSSTAERDLDLLGSGTQFRLSLNRANALQRARAYHKPTMTSDELAKVLDGMDMESLEKEMEGWQGSNGKPDGLVVDTDSNCKATSDAEQLSPPVSPKDTRSNAEENGDTYRSSRPNSPSNARSPRSESKPSEASVIRSPARSGQDSLQLPIQRSVRSKGETDEIAPLEKELFDVMLRIMNAMATRSQYPSPLANRMAL